MTTISDDKLIGMLESVARTQSPRSVVGRAAKVAAARISTSRFRHHVGERTEGVKAVEAMELPVPRLQFRWERIERDADGYDWFCHYELVIGLHKHDIRNPHEHSQPGEIAIALGGCRRGSDKEPYWPDEQKVDTPYRDHSHACWDGWQLGRLPVYAIYGDKVSKVEMRYDEIEIDPPEWRVNTQNGKSGFHKTKGIEP